MILAKLYRKGKPKGPWGWSRYADEKVKIDNMNIPIIDFDNSLLYEIGSEDYQKTFKIPEIDGGLTFYKGQYYYFKHNIVLTPKGYHDSAHSYDIYPITNDLARKIIDNKSVNTWEVKFNSFYNYNEFYISIRRGGYTEWYKYESELVGDSLYIPYVISPSNMTDGETIGKYLEDYYKEYKDKNLTLNKRSIRNLLIEEII